MEFRLNSSYRRSQGELKIAFALFEYFVSYKIEQSLKEVTLTEINYGTT